jgi:hypothetical protein
MLRTMFSPDRVQLLHQIQLAINIRPSAMGQLGDDGGGGRIYELAESTGEVHSDGGIHGSRRSPRKMSTTTSTAGPVDRRWGRWQWRPRVPAESTNGGGRGVVATLTQIGVAASSIRRRCVGPKDHVWFEDRWMVASLCDE